MYNLGAPSMARSEKNNSVDWSKELRDGLVWVGGFSVGMYSGFFNMMVPVGFTIVAWWLGNKTPRLKETLFLPCVAVQVGQVLWLALGVVILGKIHADLVDIAIVVAGVVWLLVKPGLLPILFLTCFQVLALGINITSIAGAAVGSNNHKALFVHIIFRVAAVFLMYLRFNRATSVAPVSGPPAG
jgi:hypothetical protein